MDTGVIWSNGRIKITHQVFGTDSRRWRIRTFHDDVIRSVRVAAGRHRFSFVIAKRGK